MTKEEKYYYDLVRNELTDDLLKEEYRDKKVSHKYYGHCFHATHALYRLFEGKKNGYKIQKAVDKHGITHYWLKSPSEEEIDPTKEQYTDSDRKLLYKCKKDNRASYREPKESKIIVKNIMENIK